MKNCKSCRYYFGITNVCTAVSREKLELGIFKIVPVQANNLDNNCKLYKGKKKNNA